MRHLPKRAPGVGLADLEAAIDRGEFHRPTSGGRAIPYPARVPRSGYVVPGREGLEDVAACLRRLIA